MTAQSKHWKLGDLFLQISSLPGLGKDGQNVQPKLIFTKKDINYGALYGLQNAQPYVKDAFHSLTVNGKFLSFIAKGLRALYGMHLTRETWLSPASVPRYTSNCLRNLRVILTRSSLMTS